MSHLPVSEKMLASVRNTIIRSFRWKTFEMHDKKFPSYVFFDMQKKYKCKKPQTICKHLLCKCYLEDAIKFRQRGKILTSVEFLKTLEFIRYNGGASEDDLNGIIIRLSEWIVSRTDEYQKAEWYYF